MTESPEEAAAFIKLGGIVAFPTETVYGPEPTSFKETAIAGASQPNSGPRTIP